ncbi:hypothetical protein CIB84_007055 [Bambusicola thoracicus]|uniref:Uncharacterized protein n=1 Tax=Bambusicola thoracicus TaxID=9083 RepID=A0A2P4SYM1_BAMTH|nr:hypothetical protein CIB84_007055 [Bambusicola thoracicus]
MSPLLAQGTASGGTGMDHRFTPSVQHSKQRGETPFPCSCFPSALLAKDEFHTVLSTFWITHPKDAIQMHSQVP